MKYVHLVETAFNHERNEDSLFWLAPVRIMSGKWSWRHPDTAESSKSDRHAVPGTSGSGVSDFPDKQPLVQAEEGEVREA